MNLRHIPNISYNVVKSYSFKFLKSFGIMIRNDTLFREVLDMIDMEDEYIENKSRGK